MPRINKNAHSDAPPPMVFLEQGMPPPATAYGEAELTRRIRAVLQGQSNDSVALWCEHSAETVRRYLHGDSPSARFLMTLCQHEQISGQWLLCGDGPPKVHHMWDVAVRACPLPELFAEVGRRLEGPASRILGVESESPNSDTQPRSSDARRRTA